MRTPVFHIGSFMVFGLAAAAILSAQPANPPAQPSNAFGANSYTNTPPLVIPNTPPPVVPGTLVYSGGTTINAGPPNQRGPQGPRIMTPPASPACTIKQRVGLTDITVVYARPSVRGRTVFGDMLPWGEVWRTGANSETTIEFSTDVTLNGNPIPAGKYGLYTIPGKDDWTIIIDKHTGMWGSFTYDPKEDFVRFPVKPATLAAPVETFNIGFDDLRDDTATINLSWQNTRVPIALCTGLVDKILADIDKFMSSSEAKSPAFYNQCAAFYNENAVDHHLDLNKALSWINACIDGQKDNPRIYVQMVLKGRIQAKLGDKAGALATGRKALDMATHDLDPKTGKLSTEGIEYSGVARVFVESLQK